MSTRFFLSLCLSFLLLPGGANAEKVIDLYDTHLLVINQTPEIRRRAATDMLASVFVRLSGSREVLRHPRVKRAVVEASKYVYEFSYQSTDEEITLAGTTFPASKLQLKFSASPLEAILLEEKLPLWSARRPETLVWLAADNIGETSGKGYVAEGSVINNALALSASGRGLPFVTPVLDLEDRSNLPLANIWALDEQGILAASNRYDLDAVLAGRIAKNRKGYRGSFILHHQKRSLYFNVEGASEQDLSDVLMDRVADYFASIYAFVEDDSRTGQAIEIVVTNARDFSVYAKLTRYLESIKILNGVVLSGAAGAELGFSIGYTGEPERLLKIFALDKKLAFINRKEILQEVTVNPASEGLPGDPFSLSPLPESATKATTQLVFNWIDPDSQ